jgi:lysophospholipase L1-like esterase
MELTSFAQSLFARFRSPRNRRRRKNSSVSRALRARPRVEQLEIREVPAVLHLATLGDSLTAPYPATAPYGANGDQSWTQQLQDLRGNKIHIENLAVPGATSDDVLSNQAGQAADLVAAGRVDYVSLIVGANDVFTHLPAIFSGPAAFIQSYASDVANNVARTVDVVKGAGDVGIVIGNVPDVTMTPAFQIFVGQTFGDFAPIVIQATSAAIVQANSQIQAIATADGIPVVDLFHLSQAAAAGLTVGGVEITNPYAPDFFHPNTVAQGILGNAMLESLHVAYHTPLQPLRMSDQEILAEVGIAAATNHPRTYFDVSPYVLFDHAPVLVP